jgi:hypothetical protein
LLTACAKPPGGAADIVQVASTTSFGMCAGYCRTRLEISAEGAVLVREASGRGAGADLPEQRFTAPLSAADWREIARLAAAADIDGLPDTIGCPDCADGGAESLTIITEDGGKTITFDHGATIKEAAPLLERVRALRASLTPREQP